jgi:hypothetical protein
VEQPLPTREVPHTPEATSQLEELQSESCVHLGRHSGPLELEKQRCSARQSGFEAQVWRQSLFPAPTPTQAEPAGQAALAQSRVQ